MGSRKVPDLATIIRSAKIPVKVSCVVDAPNRCEIDRFLTECHRIGVKRVVLRRLYGDTTPYTLLADCTPSRFFKNNPVYDLDGMEVTVWNFDDTTYRSLNLFADGTLGSNYLLTKTPEILCRPVMMRQC